MTGDQSTAAPPAFERFVAIDWSGGRGTRHRAIVVASAAAGDAAPAVLDPPHPRGWARAEVAALVRAWGEAGERVLVGFDFSFAMPFADRGAYLPAATAAAASGAPASAAAVQSYAPAPANARALWAAVARQSEAAGTADLGAADFVDAHPDHYYRGAESGPKGPYQRWRACETAFNARGGGKAASVFDCVGAAQVAKASVAGMRLLDALDGAVAVWPFDRVASSGPLVVEIYCRAFLRHAGGSGRKIRTRAELDRALDELGSQPSRGSDLLSDHATDALVSAAGLRWAAPQPHFWHPPGLTADVRATEGWTFGVA